MMRMLAIGILGYIALIIMLRITGNRTLSKMNSFDFIITIALGSTLSSGLLQKSVSLFDLIFALGLLIALQYCVTWLSVRSKKFEDLIKTSPTFLVKGGEFQLEAMKQARVTKEEIITAARKHGVKFEKVDQATLETDGSISIS